MIHQWEKNIPTQSTWAPPLAGHFRKHGEETLFFWTEGNGVSILAQGKERPRALFIPPALKILLPESWELFESQGASWFLLSETAALDLNKLQVTRGLPPGGAEYRRLRKKERLRDGVLWSDGEYCIRAKSQSSYLCEIDGKKAWSFSGRAYLYTPMIRYGDHICFGTAGNGGYVYLLSLKTGELIASFKTGGTIDIAVRGRCCYFLANCPSAQLMCVDLATGQALQQLPLTGKTAYSPLALIDDRLHTVTFKFKEGLVKQALWHCVSITGEQP